MGQDIVRHSELILPGILEITPTGLRFDPNTSEADWLEVGRRLGHIESGYQWWIGDWWAYGEHRYGERKRVLEEDDEMPAFQTCMNAAWVASKIETSRRREVLSFMHHTEVAALDQESQEKWLSWAENSSFVDEDTGEVKRVSARELRAAIRRPQNVIEPPPPKLGTYHTILVDPPWPIEKIAREVRPNQKAMDYPSMTPDELVDWGHKHLVPAARADCHLYLWTTHKHLPLALELVSEWGFVYQCLLTWVKNVGFTPFSWMYSTELVIFAHKGSLDLLKKGKRLDFGAKVREHSRKPDVFYDLVKEVSPGPRLEMFSREEREGFDTWGAEKGTF